MPKTIQEALSKIEWAQAVQEEMKELKDNSTWEVVQKPMGKSIVGCIEQDRMDSDNPRRDEST